MKTYRIIQHRYFYNKPNYNSKNYQDEYTDMVFDSKEEAEQYLTDQGMKPLEDGTWYEPGTPYLNHNEYADSDFTIEER
jgi:hypothetical protein|tara:strand:- start:307 stop:543 length:237 start_codon:yes stop_codon:yes gene_type:complete